MKDEASTKHSDCSNVEPLVVAIVAMRMHHVTVHVAMTMCVARYGDMHTMSVPMYVAMPIHHVTIHGAMCVAMRVDYPMWFAVHVAVHLAMPIL